MARLILVFLAVAQSLWAQATLSEILSNEPAGRVRLEWIEIYNRSQYDVDLHDYLLIADTDTSRVPTGSIIPGESFAIVARQLLPENGSDSFEGFWGDSSGIWGDSYLESYPAFDGGFQLSNGSGTVVLADTAGLWLDSYSWYDVSDDGRSVEKDDLGRDFATWHNCFDPRGSTPGEENSTIPDSGAESFVAEIYPKMISTKNGVDVFDISVIVPPGGKVSIEIFDDSGLRITRLIDDDDSSVINISWDGRSDSGDRLSPGIYIVAVSLSGQVNSDKYIPVVIAP